MMILQSSNKYNYSMVMILGSSPYIFVKIFPFECAVDSPRWENVEKDDFQILPIRVLGTEVFCYLLRKTKYQSTEKP